MVRWIWLGLWIPLVVCPVFAQGSGGGGGNRAEPNPLGTELRTELVRTEVDRAFRHTTLLLNLLVLVLLLLPIALGLGLWGLRRSIILQLVQMATDEAQKQIKAQAEATIAEVFAQQLTHYQITLAALHAQSRQTLEQEWQKRLNTLHDTTERVPLTPPSSTSTLQQLRHWLSEERTDLPPTLYQALVNWSPEMPLTGADCLLLGQVWQRLGEWEQALSYYQRACEVQPEAWENWYHLGLALNHLHRYAEALKSFEHALSLQPQASQIHQHWQAALEKLKNTE
jgi:tetratricopeptide (TPR) repeat protein